MTPAAGFNMERVIVAHLLVPQIENSIRRILSNIGLITSKLDASLLQEEDKLDSLLRREKTEEIFGSDVVFNLKALLVSKYGANFRHNLAHGLVGEAECYSVVVAEIWWLVLRICRTIFLLGQAQKSEAAPDQT